MIHKKSFEVSIDSANLFLSSGKNIQAVVGTPLQQLATNSNTLENDLPLENRDNITDIDCGSLEILTDNDSHNSLFDDYVQNLSKALVFQINNAKNIVNPLINSAVEKVSMITRTGDQYEHGFEIIPQAIPQPLFNDELIKEVKQNVAGALIDPRKSILIPGQTLDGILESLKIGSEVFDQSIQEWFVSVGDKTILEFWNSFFAPVTESGLGKRPEFVQYITGKDKANKALFVYLISRKLLHTDPPENTGVSLGVWRETIRDHINVSATVLSKEYDFYLSDVQSKKLVQSYNPISKQVVVCEKTYLDYINSGGKNELILGAIIADKIPYYLKTVLDDEDQWQQRWDRYSSINKQSVLLKAFNNFKLGLESTLISQLSELVEFEQEQVSKQPNFVEAVSDLYRKAIYNLPIESMNDVHHTVTKLVCECRFPYTNAYRFLDSINDICKNDPGIEPREAALIATIEYICDHLSDQVMVVK